MMIIMCRVPGYPVVRRVLGYTPKIDVDTREYPGTFFFRFNRVPV